MVIEALNMNQINEIIYSYMLTNMSLNHTVLSVLGIGTAGCVMCSLFSPGTGLLVQGVDIISEVKEHS